MHILYSLKTQNSMKQIMKLSGWLLAACCSGALMAQDVVVSTPNNSLVLKAKEGETPKVLYYGGRIAESDVQNLSATVAAHNAFPVYGMDCPSESALAVTHADGNYSLDMVLTGTSTREENNATVMVLEMKDRVYPFYLNLCYRAYRDADVIEAWTEIRHTEKKPVVLRQFASAYLPIRRGNVWISHLSGSWGNEGFLTQEALTPGLQVIKNRDGVRNSHTDHAEVMFSLEGQPSETTGEVIAAALCYSGNYKLRVETHDDDYHHFFAGINDEHSPYTLKKDEIFVTPELALTYSSEGLSGGSRNLHRWARLHKLANGTTLRKILLNSWEGVYFDINQEGMDQMMKDIASMGGELFVMDDGWFGQKYPRKTDNSSLGDWVVDTEKLPEGINGLLRSARNHGVKFGLWIEPEMANTVSELYEKHPDWILKAPERDPVLGRGGTQVVLDLANPAVQDFIFNLVDTLMTRYPELDYIKWDANMSVMNHGSQYLPATEQGHLFIAYHRGLEQVWKRVRAKYPRLTIQACASGGGRANYGVLPYFDEFWVSDNTDALQRVYMQWGTSYFFPAIAMASHISAAPNHQTGRTIPLKYRIDVAMSGRLGMEIQPKHMTDEEKEFCRKAIADYKRIRPIVQQGDIYRLLSPYDRQGAASLMYVTERKDEAVFFWWKTEHFVNQHLPRVRMSGLDPQRLYTVRELNRVEKYPLAVEGRTFTGRYLMEQGLEIPYSHRMESHKQMGYSSRVLLLEAAK